MGGLFKDRMVGIKIKKIILDLVVIPEMKELDKRF